ncbi:MAG: FAD-binding oxidoreductase [Burkholderiales bacterium]|nr:FAD-binding oxidoreductase [Burkholderiales bacterium]
MIADLISQLSQILSIDGIISDPLKKKPFETEWRSRYSNSALAVVFPNSIEQIQQLIYFCQSNQIGIVPQGGNTSTSVGAIPLNLSQLQIIINLSRLNRIIEINKANHSIIVEAGCTLHQVQTAAMNTNLYFPLSIGSEGSCQIGGNIATNAGGIHVIKYGMMRNLTLGLEAILPNGKIVNQLCQLRKNNINFDLKQLFIGSEGTLGIITKACLKLFPPIIEYFTGLVGISDINQAINLLNELSKHYSVCAFEIINRTTQQIYNTHFSRDSFPICNNWLILFELEINSNFNINTFNSLMQELNLDLELIIVANTEKERQALWHKRENIPLAEKMAGVAIKHDISLPINNIEQFITVNKKKLITKYPNAQIIIFGHLGDGNLHYNIQLGGSAYTDNLQIENEINTLVYEDVYRYSGSFSAEHGIGSLKKSWMIKYYDPGSYQLAKQVKDLLDPNNILNPGKIF